MTIGGGGYAVAPALFCEESAMPDARPGHGTPIDLAKLRTLSIGSRTRPVVREGRDHPETGRPWKATTTEAGTVTEHSTKDDRVDAVARVETIRAVHLPGTEGVRNVRQQEH